MSIMERRGIKRNMKRALEKNDVQGVLELLTVKQRKFCEEYLKDLNATQAIIRAGYQTKYPENMGAQLLKHQGIRTAIDAMLSERKANSKVTEDYVLKKIVRILEKCEKDDDFNPQAALRAAELLGKHLAMFTEKQEITGADGGAIQFEKLKNDADAFTSAIAGLVKRGGKDGVAEQTQH